MSVNDSGSWWDTYPEPGLFDRLASCLRTSASLHGHSVRTAEGVHSAVVHGGVHHPGM